MGIMPIPTPETNRPQHFMGQTVPAYTHHNDKYPSLSWGFLLYGVRWHMHRMKQADIARLLGVRQEDISAWERGQKKVPQTVRTWIATVLLTRLEDGLEVPLPVGALQPSRNERQKLIMDQHGTFGGKGKTRTRKTKKQEEVEVAA